MSQLGKTNLIKNLTDAFRKGGWSDRQIKVMVESLWRDPFSLRTSGFDIAGGTDAEISFDNITRTFKIQPLNFDDPVNPGKKFAFYSFTTSLKLHKKYGPEEIVITDEEGLFAIYYDQVPQTLEFILHYSKNPSREEKAEFYLKKVIVAWIYYVPGTGAIHFGDSRHGSEWIPSSHWMEHQTFNSRRELGISIFDATYNGDGSNDNHFQFGISTGKLWHEDIQQSFSGIDKAESLPVWYFDSAGQPRFSAEAGKKFLNNGLVAYNSGGSLIPVTDKYFVLYHLFATNCQLQPHISVMGQTQHATIADAYATIQEEAIWLRASLPHESALHIGTVIIQSSTEFTNSAQARLVTWGSGSDDTQPHIVHQIAHGFSEKQAIRHNGTLFVLAQANNDVNAQTAGIVVEIIDDDHFRYQSGGFYAHVDWVAGAEYFLSADTPGLVTTLPDPEVWGIGEIRQSLGWGTDQGLKIEIDVGDEIVSDVLESYIYIAYASDNSGSDFSLTPTNSLKYRAEIHVESKLDPPTASDFAVATWIKYIGDDGADGIGSDGREVELRINAGWFEWRYVGDATWMQLIEIPTSSDFYTIIQLQTSGQSQVHWNNITNKPSLDYYYAWKLQSYSAAYQNRNYLIGSQFSVNFWETDAIDIEFYGAANAGTIKIHHKDTSDQASVANIDNIVIQSITLDNYGHVTALASKNIILSHPDTSAQPSVPNTGDFVIQSITLDEFGHITAITSKEVTPGSPTMLDWTQFEYRDVEAGVAEEYWLDAKALIGYTITSAVLKTDSGTLYGISVKINGSSVSGLSSMSAGTSISQFYASSGNVVQAGDRVTLTTSSSFSGTPTRLIGKINFTRNAT